MTQRFRVRRSPPARIRIGGFKSFRDPVDVPIRALTILAGTNSAGKSSFLQPLLLMKQTLEARFDPGGLLLDGDLVHVEEAATLFWRGRNQRSAARTWWVEVSGREWGGRVEYSRAPGAPGGLRLDRTVDTAEGIELTDPLTEEATRQLRDRLTKMMGSLATPGSTFRALRGRVSHLAIDELGFAELNPFPSEFLLDLIHLPGLRGNPKRAYPLTRSDSRFVGTFQEYTAGTLLSWKEAKDSRLGGVGDDLRALGLTWKVEPSRRGDTSVEVRIGRLPGPQRGGAGDLVNIADVGFGASQVLPVVVALRAAGPGQLVHIEQPELHLHPGAQAALAGLLINAARRGAVVITETHSSILLRALQREAASSDDVAKLVSLSWFERDAEGATGVRSGELDRTGAYGDWPVDFSDVEAEVERDLLDAAFHRMTS